MSWDWTDVLSLPERDRALVLARLVEDETRDRVAGRALDPDRARTIRQLRAGTPKSATTPATPPAVRGPRRRGKRAGEDIGDLFEPNVVGLERGPERIVVLLDPVVELVNGWVDDTGVRRGFTHHRIVDRVEARWTALALAACITAALTPIHGGAAHIFVWHLRDRNRSTKLPDFDAATHPIKGALDGIVRAGVLPDDGPGHARTVPLVEPVWSSHTGLVFHLVPATGLPLFPLTTVGHS